MPGELSGASSHRPINRNARKVPLSNSIRRVLASMHMFLDVCVRVCIWRIYEQIHHGLFKSMQQRALHRKRNA